MPTLMGAGDRDAWNSLIGRYLPQLKRFAERHLPTRLRGTITADDLLHEVVMRGSRQLHRAGLAFLLPVVESLRF